MAGLTKRVLLVTASAQLRTVTSALLRRYSPVVAADFSAAIETAAAAGRGSDAEGRYAAAVVDLDLVSATDTSGGCGKEGIIELLRAALWDDGEVGVIVGIATSSHAKAAKDHTLQCSTPVKGIDAVLQRCVDEQNSSQLF